MNDSTKGRFLRRYTELPFLIDFLETKEITLLNPSAWDDRNDSYYLQQYAEAYDKGVTNANWDWAQFIDTVDDAVTFELRIDEVEIQLDFVVENNGQFPLTIESGEISDIITSSDGTAIGGSNSLDGLPIAMAPRSQQVLQSITEIVKISGRAGDDIEYLFNIVAENISIYSILRFI